jgi:hypothetical protein
LTVAIGGVLLGACGSTATQSTSAKTSTSATGSKTTKTTKTTTTATTSSEYLNIYQGIPNTPITSNGYPFGVPDSMRILAPNLLKKEVLDTKLAKIGDIYIGTTWTPTQRMDIYTAKMGLLYGLAFGLPQYLTTTGPEAITNKAILSHITNLFVPFYGSVQAVEQQMVTTNENKAIFRLETPGSTVLGVNTVIGSQMNVTNIALTTYKPGIEEVSMTFAKGQGGAESELNSSSPPAQIDNDQALVTQQPGEWSYVWPIDGFGLSGS